MAHDNPKAIEQAKRILEQRKRSDPLQWFIPTPTQEQFLRRDTVKEPFVLINAGNRCLAPSQRIYDPIAGEHRRVDSIADDWHVMAFDGKGLVATDACKPFVKKPDHYMRLSFSDGSTLECSPRHLLLASDGRWTPVSSLCMRLAGQLLQESTWDICLQASRADDPHWSEIDEGSLADCRLSGRLYDPQLRVVGAYAQGCAPLPADAHAHSHQTSDQRPSGGLQDGLAYTPARTPTCPSSDHPSIVDGQDHYAAPCAASSAPACGTQPPRSTDRLQAGQQPSAGLAGQPQSTGADRSSAARLDVRVSPCYSPPLLMTIIGVEIFGQGPVWDFEVPKHHNYVAGNTINHNSGKSACTMADLALMLRGIHPYRPNYTNLTVVVFAPTRMQAANVIAHKLFDDSELKLPEGSPPEAMNQPMIPAWEIERLSRPMQAGMRVPKEVVLKNGNRAIFSWTGVEDQDAKIAGLKIDAVYIDEEAGNTRLLAEIAARLADALSDKSRPGLGFYVWAYTNTRYNEAFDNFKQRASEGVAGHKVYEIGMGENPAVSAEARALLSGTMDSDQARIRMEGGVDAGALVQIYHKQWSDSRHVLPAEYTVNPTDNIWIGYDPGVDHPMGMIACAINAEMPLRLTCVQAWSSRNETIEDDANRLQKWLRGRKIAGFVYDTNLKNKDRGGGQTVLQRFKDLLLARGIDPLGGYYQSKKNHAPGIAMCRHYLDPNPDDRTVPPLFMLSKPTDANGTGMLRQQILKYRGKESTKFTGAGGVVKKDDDLVDPFRYLVMQRPSYNPKWACGYALDIATQRVANLDANDNIPVRPTTMDTPAPPRFDFSAGKFYSRSRDRKRGGWQVVGL